MESIKEEKGEQPEGSKHKFTLRELGGAFGDWGTLIPFIIGYVSIVGLKPGSIFLCLGITNIVLGIRHDLPLPVQPQKTIATVALSQGWTPGMVVSTGFGTGVIWSILGFSKQLNKLVAKVPMILVRGIQLGLGLILGWKAIELLADNWWVAVISCVIILALFRNKRVPSAIILVVLGIVLLVFQGTLNASSIIFTWPEFDFYLPTWNDFWIGFLLAGIGQLILTLTNVMIATVALAGDLFPEKKDSFDANALAQNMGVMNALFPFIGGMPVCHGSGGLAAQYAFGARNGGSMIMEGIIEIGLGLFFSNTLFLTFSTFPKAILGSMLLYTAIVLSRVGFKDFEKRNAPIIIISAVVSFVFNISVGFIVGLVIYLIVRKKLSTKAENEKEIGNKEKKM